MVRGVHRPARQRRLTVQLRQRDRRAGTQGSVGVHREPGQRVGLGQPQPLAVRGERRGLLPDAAVGHLQVGRGRRPDRPDEFVRLQVEDLQDDRLVGARGGQEPAVGADGRAHDLAVVGDQSVADGFEDLVVGDLQALGVEGADLVVVEARGAGVGHPSPTTTRTAVPAAATCNGRRPRRCRSSIRAFGVVRRRVTGFIGVQPLVVAVSRSTEPSNCHKGLGAWPVAAWTGKKPLTSCGPSPSAT